MSAHRDLKSQIELRARLIHYFLWSNKNNINHYLEGCGIFEIREFFPHKRPTKETYKERERVRNRQDSSF